MCKHKNNSFHSIKKEGIHLSVTGTYVVQFVKYIKTLHNFLFKAIFLMAILFYQLFSIVVYMYSHSNKHICTSKNPTHYTLIRRRMCKKTTPEVPTFVDGRPNFKLERKGKIKVKILLTKICIMYTKAKFTWSTYGYVSTLWMTHP